MSSDIKMKMELYNLYFSARLHMKQALFEIDKAFSEINKISMVGVNTLTNDYDIFPSFLCNDVSDVINAITDILDDCVIEDDNQDE